MEARLDPRLLQSSALAGSGEQLAWTRPSVGAAPAQMERFYWVWARVRGGHECASVGWFGGVGDAHSSEPLLPVSLKH